MKLSTEYIADLNRNAMNGDIDAQYALAKTFEDGDHPDCYGGDPDYIEAERWYLRAADQGCVEAMHELANIYGNRDLDCLIVVHNENGTFKETVLNVYDPVKAAEMRQRAEQAIKLDEPSPSERKGHE